MTTATPAGHGSDTETAERVQRYDWAAVARNSTPTAARCSSGCCPMTTAVPSRVSTETSRISGATSSWRGTASVVAIKYFTFPLPETIEALRVALYLRLAPIANRWNEAMRVDARYPGNLADFLQRCLDAGQKRPTPLLQIRGWRFQRIASGPVR